MVPLSKNELVAMSMIAISSYMCDCDFLLYVRHDVSRVVGGLAVWGDPEVTSLLIYTQNSIDGVGEPPRHP